MKKASKPECFWLSTDFFDDKRLLELQKEYGLVAFEIALYLAGKICINGYFAIFEELRPAMSERYSISEEEVEEIVCSLVDKGIFDKKVFDEFGVLTDGGIQAEYLALTGNPIDERYNIINTDAKKESCGVRPLFKLTN